MRTLVLLFLAALSSFLSFGTVGPITGPASGCQSTSWTLGDTTAGGIWSSSNPTVATIGSSSGTVTGTSMGTATITYNVGGSYSILTLTVLPTVADGVSIITSPTLPVLSGTTVVFSAVPTNGGAAPTYQWMRNGVVVAAGDTFSCSPMDGDNITVCMRSSIACAMPSPVCSADTVVTLTATKNNLLQMAPPIIYPNPATNEVTIAYSFLDGNDGIFELMDVTGTVRKYVIIHSNMQGKLLDLSDLSSGVYIYKVIQQGQIIASGKLIKGK